MGQSIGLLKEFMCAVKIEDVSMIGNKAKYVINCNVRNNRHKLS